VDYSLVKKAIADAVRQAEIPNLTCYPYLPDNPELPCFWAGEVQIRANNAFGLRPGGFDITTITCGVFVGGADDKDAQRMLDRLISDTGDYSVREALYTHGSPPGDHALGGLADDLAIDSVDGYGQISLGENRNYYGATIAVRLIGKGDA
jgi:hypothetical protein